jgi:hypothetical protein
MLTFQVLPTNVKPTTGMAVTLSRREPAFFLSTTRSYGILPNTPTRRHSGLKDG